MLDACRGNMLAKPIIPAKKEVQFQDDKIGKDSTKLNVNNVTSTAIINIQENDCKNQMVAVLSGECKNADIHQNYHHAYDHDQPTESFYHPRANFMIVFANPEGYAASDGGDKGGYLIRAMKRVLSNIPSHNRKHNLEDSIVKIRIHAAQMAGLGSIQCVEHVSTMTYNVSFS